MCSPGPHAGPATAPECMCYIYNASGAYLTRHFGIQAYIYAPKIILLLTRA